MQLWQVLEAIVPLDETPTLVQLPCTDQRIPIHRPCRPELSSSLANSLPSRSFGFELIVVLPRLVEQLALSALAALRRSIEEETLELNAGFVELR